MSLPAVATDKAVVEPVPVSISVRAGSPEPMVATPEEEAVLPPDRQLSDPVTEAPPVAAELPPPPRYNLRPRKQR